jgi:hypothetical protein
MSLSPGAAEMLRQMRDHAAKYPGPHSHAVGPKRYEDRWFTLRHARELERAGEVAVFARVAGPRGGRVWYATLFDPRSHYPRR